MFEVRTTAIFDRWLTKLRDRKGQTMIAHRVRRLSAGSLGDVKPVAKGVSELRIHFGPGYRVYLTQRGKQIIAMRRRQGIAEARYLAGCRAERAVEG